MDAKVLIDLATKELTVMQVYRDVRITWSYPEIYDRAKQNWIELYLSHTRAADPIRIKYDSERNGWSIEQASTFEWEADDKICDPDWQEVVFIESWARGQQRSNARLTRRVCGAGALGDIHSRSRKRLKRARFEGQLARASVRNTRLLKPGMP